MTTVAKKMKTARESAAELGRVLYEVRTLRGLSMPQVEKKTNGAVGRSLLSRIEGGSRANPSLATLGMLAVAYDVDLKITRDGKIVVNGTRLTELAEKAKKEEQRLDRA